LVADDGGARDRTGGISISLSSSDDHVIGGAVAMLIAATPVLVVYSMSLVSELMLCLCTFFCKKDHVCTCTYDVICDICV
jgi:hypothetical protein